MSKIQLGEEQVCALQEIEKFLESSKPAFCLYGSAGTGKSFMINQIIKVVCKKKMQYALIAPTHKAALVMTQYTGQDAETIHSILALSPNLEILKLDFSQLMFQSKSSEKLPVDGVVICDEASMINDDLYNVLIDKCSELNTKVIFVGDIKQLQPVEGRNYSKVFSIPDSFQLTKIYRQNDGSAIAPLLVELRESVLYNVQTKEAEEGSIFVYDQIKPYVDQIVKHTKEAIEKKDVMWAKVLAYTNGRVSDYNRVVHGLVFGKENKYCQGEIMTAYGNFNGSKKEFFNGMDYIIEEEPTETNITFREIPDICFHAYVLKLYDQLLKCSDMVYMLDPDTPYDYFVELASISEQLRIDALAATGKRRAILWSRYFKLTRSACFPIDVYYDDRLILKKNLDYGYAITVHKSQGSSIQNIFVDLKDIRKQKIRDELRQLEYVALSRARKDVYIYI